MDPWLTMMCDRPLIRPRPSRKYTIRLIKFDLRLSWRGFVTVAFCKLLFQIYYTCKEMRDRINLVLVEASCWFTCDIRRVLHLSIIVHTHAILRCRNNCSYLLRSRIYDHFRAELHILHFQRSWICNVNFFSVTKYCTGCMSISLILIRLLWSPQQSAVPLVCGLCCSYRSRHDVKLHPHRVMSRAWRYKAASTFSLSLVAFCTDVSWGRPVSVSSCTVVFLYESWSYLI